MQKRLVLSAAAVATIAFAALACGGGEVQVQVGGPAVAVNNPISVGDWCNQVTNSFCGQIAGCTGIGEPIRQGCMATAPTACIGSRNPGQASGKFQSDLSACLSSVQQAGCTQQSWGAIGVCSLGN